MIGTNQQGKGFSFCLLRTVVGYQPATDVVPIATIFPSQFVPPNAAGASLALVPITQIRLLIGLRDCLTMNLRPVVDMINNNTCEVFNDILSNTQIRISQKVQHSASLNFETASCSTYIPILVTWSSFYIYHQLG